MTIDLSRFLCDNLFDSGHRICDKLSVGFHIKNLDTQAEIVVSYFDEYVSLPWLQKSYTDFNSFLSFVFCPRVVGVLTSHNYRRWRRIAKEAKNDRSCNDFLLAVLLVAFAVVAASSLEQKNVFLEEGC
jgi:hypothetical protein